MSATMPALMTATMPATLSATMGNNMSAKNKMGVSSKTTAAQKFSLAMEIQKYDGRRCRRC